MFFDAAAEVEQLVRRRTKLDADRPFPELFDELRVLHQRKRVSDALGVEEYGVVQIRVARIAGSARVKERLASVEHERNVDVERLACADESQQLIPVKVDRVGPVLGPDEIEPCSSNR